MKSELLKGLSMEQIEKVKSCKSASDMLELAKAEGVKLTAEQLSAVSGGGCSDDDDKGSGEGHRKIDS